MNPSADRGLRRVTAVVMAAASLFLCPSFAFAQDQGQVVELELDRNGVEVAPGEYRVTVRRPFMFTPLTVAQAVDVCCTTGEKAEERRVEDRAAKQRAESEAFAWKQRALAAEEDRGVPWKVAAIGVGVAAALAFLAGVSQ